MLSPRHGKIAFHRQTKWCSGQFSINTNYVSVSFANWAGTVRVIETKQMDVGSKIYSVQFKIIGIRKSFVRI
jgi:hypothetical protein